MNTRLFKLSLLALLLLVFTPMVSAQSVTVTGYTRTDEDWMQAYWFQGVIENQGETSVMYSEVTISFYDEDQVLIYSETQTADVRMLKPGEKSPFTVIVDYLNYTSLEFEVAPTSLSSSPYRDFTITEVSRGTDTWGLNSVTYEVKNTGDVDMDTITLYGIYSNTNEGYLDYSMSSFVEELPSGQTATMTLEMIPLEATDSYVILDCLEMDPESSTSTTTDTNPDSEADTETSGGGIPGFPVYGLLIGALSVTYLLQRKPSF